MAGLGWDGFYGPCKPRLFQDSMLYSSLSGSVELPPGNEECDDPFWKNSMLLPLSADPLCVEVAPLRHFCREINCCAAALAAQ